MLRTIDHFIGGSSFASGERQATSSTPTRARSRPASGLAERGRSRARDGGGAGGAARMGGDQPAAPRPGDVQLQGAGRSQHGRARRAAVERARQGHRRRQGRHPARARGGRICLRHPARAEGRIYRRRGSRDRRLFDAPAARHRRRHHPVQLPGDDPDVDVRGRHRLRQRLHPQASASATRACRCAWPN